MYILRINLRLSSWRLGKMQTGLHFALAPQRRVPRRYAPRNDGNRKLFILHFPFISRSGFCCKKASHDPLFPLPRAAGFGTGMRDEVMK